MSDEFIGRSQQLALLEKRLRWVKADGSGAALTIRGRRQVGKSRLVQEFCDRAGLPYFYYTAIRGSSPVESIRRFSAGLRNSPLVDDPDPVPTLDSGNWLDALHLLASMVKNSPVIVVIDELPWLAEQDATFDGTLQMIWDRMLAHKPVMLCLLGSDIHMMERLTSYEAPFHGRSDNLVLGPFHPGETAAALGLSGSEALDARLVSGGIPGILHRWPHSMPVQEYLREECADPASPLFDVPETALLSEFPSPNVTRRVLDAIGTGDRTHATIAATAGSHQGHVPSGTLSPILRQLVADKRVLAMDEPLSTSPGKPALYRLADSNLRFYLAAARDAREESYRGRPRRAFQTLTRAWKAWRGRAIEPIIREAVELACADGVLPWTDAAAIGGWWNRRFDPEIDLVGADRGPVSKHVYFAGSIKWLGTAFDGHDLSDLINGAAQVPGFRRDSGLMIASLSGVDRNTDMTPVSVVWGPDDVLAAFSSSA